MLWLLSGQHYCWMTTKPRTRKEYGNPLQGDTVGRYMFLVRHCGTSGARLVNHHVRQQWATSLGVLTVLLWWQTTWSIFWVSEAIPWAYPRKYKVFALRKGDSWTMIVPSSTTLARLVRCLLGCASQHSHLSNIQESPLRLETIASVCPLIN